MHIIKAPWFGHKANNKKCGCYTVAVNCDGTRLASGGLDGNVKIWDPRLILQFKKYKPDDEEDQPAKKKKKNCAGKATGLSKLLDEKFPERALCTMSRHNGAVTCVKFSPNGSRFLALGSDDKIVFIWEKDEEAAPQKQFGDTELDLEHWTVRKRLVAHDNDVQDIAWSPDGSLLVTVGLDRLIIIWSGNTFERIKRYDIHQSMVKGIVFDPANKFFATASDDRTVRIFRYHRKHPLRGDVEFQMEHLVIDPFRKSPLTSYFRRMSWSPDGQHIAVPNATNGPVTSVAIINRGNWGSDISLIGHEAPCEVCQFSPRLFKKGANDDSFNTVLATAGQDLSLVVWSTIQSKPIVVAENIVEDSITDICWSPDGETLYFSCLDGSITCIKFEPKELGIVAGEGINDLQLNKYGTDRESAIFAESIDQLKLEDMWKKNVEDDAEVKTLPSTDISKPEVVNTAFIVKPNETESLKPSASTGNIATLSTSHSASTTNVLKITKQNITITKDGKKRVAPMLVSSSKPSSSSLFISSSTKAKTLFSNLFNLSTKLSKTLYNLPKIGIQTSVHGLKSRLNKEFGGLDSNINEVQAEDNDNDNEDMGITEEGVGENGGVSGTTNGTNGIVVSELTRKKQFNKMKRRFLERKYPSSFRKVSNLPEFLFHHPYLVNKTFLLMSKDGGLGGGNGEWTVSSTYDTNDEDLAFSVVIGTESKYTVEVRNGPSWSNNEDVDEVIYNDRIDFQDPTVCLISSTDELHKRKYTLYFPYKIQHAIPLLGIGAKNSRELQHFAFISFSGTLQLVNSESGSYSLPSIELGCNVVVVRQSGNYFLCVTSNGLIYVWELPDIRRRKGMVGVINGVSMAPLWKCKVTEGVNEVVKITGNTTTATIRVDEDFTTLRMFEIDPATGIPYVMFEETSEIFQYSLNLLCWVKALESWYLLADPPKPRAMGKQNGTHKESIGFFEALVNKSLHIFKDNLERGIGGVYVGDNKDVGELKTKMKERFHELIELQGND